MQAVLTSFGIQGMPHVAQGLTWEAAQHTAVYKQGVNKSSRVTLTICHAHPRPIREPQQLPQGSKAELTPMGTHACEGSLKRVARSRPSRLRAR